MRIEESRKLLLSDTLVPDVFVLDYMPNLDGFAVKAYLLLLFHARGGRSVSEKDLARRLGCKSEELKYVLFQLASQNLIQMRERSIEVQDIKAIEIERLYVPREATGMPSAQTVPDDEERLTQTFKTIADTFFQGILSPAWMHDIEDWFRLYGFEPEVIYALFQDCDRRGKLSSRAYINKVAENWFKKQIRTFDDVNRHSMEQDRISRISRRIGTRLRRTITEYDEELIRQWVLDLGFDLEIIELALRRSSRKVGANLQYPDKILREWARLKLNDETAIRAYEDRRAEELAAERKSRGDTSVIGNFAQREYKSEDFDEFYADLAPSAEVKASLR